MTQEQDKRLHRCCFAGHRPEKLKASEAEIKAWLEVRIKQAINDGYVTFITGMGMGVDIWAGQIVARLKVKDPSLHLIAAIPYPGFEARWSRDWQARYHELLKQADLVHTVCDHFTDDAFRRRSEWLAGHVNRVIAYYNGESGSTRSLVELAQAQSLETVVGGMTGAFDTYVAYDFETTGLSARTESIIEIGAVKVICGEETETFQAFVRPYEGAWVSPRITELTGIAPEDVADAREISEVLPDFMRFADKLPMIGYNSIGFDHAFLQRAASLTGMRVRNEQFDVMLYAMQYQKLLGFGKPRVSLARLSERMGVNNPQAHRALADALTTSRTYLALRRLAEQTAQEEESNG